MSERYTPEPWQYSNRDWRGEEHPHNFYVVGNPGDGTCTAVAIIVGNETSGDIPMDTARRMCAAVNAVKGLSSAALESGVVKDALAALEAHDAYMSEQFRDGPESRALHPKAAENWQRVRAVLAKVREGGA